MLYILFLVNCKLLLKNKKKQQKLYSEKFIYNNCSTGNKGSTLWVLESESAIVLIIHWSHEVALSFIILKILMEIIIYAIYDNCVLLVHDE